MRRTLETGADYQAEYRIVTGGRERWVIARGKIERDAAGRVVRFPGVVLDITERKRAEQALRQGKELLDVALAASQTGTFRFDLAQGEFSEFDDNLKRLFGLPASRAVRVPADFLAVVHPDDLAAVVPAVERTVREAIDFEMEYRVVHPDGGVRWLFDRARVIRDPNGTPLYLVGACTDVTARKHAEGERQALLEAERAARSQAEAASRLKDDFLATLSHELRTPLNAILGWSQILRRRAVFDDTSEGLTVIERNARAQVQLVEDLLDMSRIVAGKLRLDVQRVDVAAVIKAAVESVTPAAEAKEIRLQIVLDTHVGPVRGDAGRLQQVVWNLLTNAIKFTAKGGKVQVALERVNSHIEITVTDTGIGIAPEFLPHVFDRFRQADAAASRKHQGLGLGLAIVKNLVEMHGGAVRAKSPGAGRGSTFSVELPLIVVHEDARSPADRQHPRVPAWAEEAELPADTLLEGVCVLLVDDEKDARELIRRVLEDCHARVLLTAGADEALALLQQARPDVLVSDIGMPGEDGYALIRRVRALPGRQGGDTPAVALTAFARSEDRRRALLAGFQAHVAKPVEPAELVTVVASVAGKMRPKRA